MNNFANRARRFLEAFRGVDEIARFNSLAFAQSTLEGRDNLCRERGKFLTAQMKDYLKHKDTRSRRDKFVKKWINRLRRVGHPLWSWDEDDDYELWGPDYQDPASMGIVVDFNFPSDIEIWWPPSSSYKVAGGANQGSDP